MNPIDPRGIRPASISDQAHDAAYHMQTVELMCDFMAIQQHRLRLGGQVTADGRHLASQVEHMFADIDAACARIEEDARAIAAAENEPTRFDRVLGEADWRRDMALGGAA